MPTVLMFKVLFGPRRGGGLKSRFGLDYCRPLRALKLRS
jgi:hypothetical protein